MLRQKVRAVCMYMRNYELYRYNRYMDQNTFWVVFFGVYSCVYLYGESVCVHMIVHLLGVWLVHVGI